MATTRFWLSWYQPGDDPRPLTCPPNEAIRGWWVSGTGDDKFSICAVVDAESEEAAKAAVRVDWPEAEKWRFCEEKPRDWKPGDRFVVREGKDNWIKERL